MLDAALENSFRRAHNQQTSFTQGEILDLKRLQKLEKLSGLQLNAAERKSLLADLGALEKFVSGLPDLPDLPDLPPATDGPDTGKPAL